MSTSTANNNSANHGNNTVSGSGINLVGSQAGNITIHQGSSSKHDVSQPWNVPRNPNALFVGRHDVLEQLGKAFKVHEQPHVNDPQVRFVITGLGGTGKSEICVQFAHTHRTAFWAVFWINAGSDSTADQSFNEIGRLLELPDPTTNHVRNRLASLDKRWLLIVDNADDPESDYTSYIPSGNRGCVLVTSRIPDSKRYATDGCSIALDQLEKRLACQLLLQAAGLRVNGEDTSEDSAAMEIVTEMGSHTLALRHAGAYIKKTCNIGDYLRIYRSQASRLFKSTKYREHSEYKTIHATFEVSISHLRRLAEEDREDASDALDLLELFPFMDRERMHMDIFSTAASCAAQATATQSTSDPDVENGTYSAVLRLNKEHAALLPKCAPLKDTGPEGNLRWSEAVELLSSLALITTGEIRGSGGFRIWHYCSMHPVVHAWAKERLTLDQQSRGWLRVLMALAFACSGMERDDNKPVLELVFCASKCLRHPVREYAARLKKDMTSAALWQLLEWLPANGNWWLTDAFELVMDTLQGKGAGNDQHFLLDRDSLTEDDLSSLMAHALGSIRSHVSEYGIQTRLGKRLLELFQGRNAVIVLESAVNALPSAFANVSLEQLDAPRLLTIAYAMNNNHDKHIATLKRLDTERNHFFTGESGRYDLVNDFFSVSNSMAERWEIFLEVADRCLAWTRSVLPDSHPLVLAAQRDRICLKPQGLDDTDLELIEDALQCAGRRVPTDPFRFHFEHAITIALASDSHLVRAKEVAASRSQRLAQHFDACHWMRIDADRDLLLALSDLDEHHAVIDLVEKLIPPLSEFYRRPEHLHDNPHERYILSSVNSALDDNCIGLLRYYLEPSSYAPSISYETRARCQLLLGRGYAIFKDPITTARPFKDVISEAKEHHPEGLKYKQEALAELEKLLPKLPELSPYLEQEVLESKAEESEAVESKAEESKAEESKAEESKAEESKAEESKAEESKAEESKAEESKTGENEGST